jgi:CheY-like chemotaxis protein
MSRILLVDDSPHAQRMGERILSDEGYEVVTVSNADAALVRLEDVDPDVVLADTVMPGRTGYDICQYVKLSPRHKYVRVILTAGVLEPFDEAHTRRVEADGTLRKPFEASVLLAAVRPLADAAAKDREAKLAGQPGAAGGSPASGKPEAAHVAPFIAVVDSEQVRAAVTVALDAAMGTMVEEITRRVLATLNKKKPDARTLEQLGAPVAAMPAAPAPLPPPAATPAVQPKPAAPPPAMPRMEAVRRVSPLRLRSGSILGLDISRPDPEVPADRPENPSETPSPEN